MVHILTGVIYVTLILAAAVVGTRLAKGYSADANATTTSPENLIAMDFRLRASIFSNLSRISERAANHKNRVRTAIILKNVGRHIPITRLSGPQMIDIWSRS